MCAGQYGTIMASLRTQSIKNKDYHKCLTALVTSLGHKSTQLKNTPGDHAPWMVLKEMGYFPILKKTLDRKEHALE